MQVLYPALVIGTLALLVASCGGDDKEPRPATPLPSTAQTVSPATAPGGASEAASWTQRAALPTPRAEIASVVLDGRIYVIAGFEASGNSSDVVEAYDAASD